MKRPEEMTTQELKDFIEKVMTTYIENCEVILPKKHNKKDSRISGVEGSLSRIE